MLKKRLKQFSIFIFAYIAVAIAFFFIGGDQIQYSEITSNLQPTQGTVPELSAGTLVEQSFYSSMDTLDSVSVCMATFGRENSGELTLSLLDGSTYQPLATKSIPASEIPDNTMYQWTFAPELTGVNGKQFILRIESTCPAGQAPTVYYSPIEEGNAAAWLNNEKLDVQLTFQFSGKLYSWFGEHYWMLAAGLGAVCITYMGAALYRESKGKCTLIMLVEGIWIKYGFLIDQLVSRDFKTKYKRSVLGYCWSFLNPLLTMMVQYVVFSTIFKNDIENFPVYLLTGTILFSFFQEAVGQGLTSILANASLITKVYMPKYIYPVTKVVSTSINLLISMIPLLIVTVLTGEPITPAFLLLPFALFCLVLFCIGFSLMLSAAMVFFRDTQYLWGIASLIWMYATPLFYPENIIPEEYQIIQKINPLYHIVKFARVILIEGVSPEPRRYLYCLVSAVAVCLIGAVIFKKSQDKFILYI